MVGTYEGYKSETVESYDQHADYFENYFKGLLEVHRRTEFEKFVALVPGKRIVDLGCGAGDHALYFKELGLSVLCVDISEKMIELCKKKGLVAEVMDIEKLTLDENSFDGIWAVTSLLHVPKNAMNSVLKTLSTVLAPRGVLYICVKEGEGEKMVEDKHDPTTRRFFSYWKHDELLGVLEKYFERIETGTQTVGHTTYLQFFMRKR